MSYIYVFDAVKCLFIITLFSPYIECSQYFIFFPILFMIFKYCLLLKINIAFQDDVFSLITIGLFIILNLFQCQTLFTILIIVYSNIIAINILIYYCYIYKNDTINTSIDNTITELDNINIHINEISEISEINEINEISEYPYIIGPHDNEWTCVICLEEQYHSVIKFKCGHSFHKQCILDWIKIKNMCPICKSKLEKPLDTNTSNNQVIII